MLLNLLKPYNRVTLQFLADELLIQTVEGEENFHYTNPTTNIETEDCIVFLLLHDERDDVRMWCACSECNKVSHPAV